MTSPWYYPSMKFDARISLEDIAEIAITVKDKRLRNRYLLQGMRALISLGRYQECVQIWENEISKLHQKDIIRRLCEQYYNGALFEVNHSAKAIEYFAMRGDVGSLLYCTNQIGKSLSPVEAISYICQYAPNSPSIALKLHNIVKGYEPIGDWGTIEPFQETEDTKKLYKLSLEMGANPAVKNQAMWYYTAAFLADLKGDIKDASRIISLAENAKSTKFIDESIAVFRMHIDAKTLKYDDVYEQKLFKQIKWLDNKIVTNLTEDAITETSYGYKLFYGVSYYWWNDMLRRILLSDVCPRMIEAGKSTRALQLANMACNRIINIVNITTKDSRIKNWRHSKSEFNEYDYSNQFFNMIDSVGVDNTIKYVETTIKPETEFDRFLNVNGYTDKNYLYDIAGTQCLRNMRYADAVKYLGKVSKSYYIKHSNVKSKYDPFSIQKTKTRKSKNFKYAFATEMNQLEKTMNSHSNPNTKANAMFRYAIGLQNSFISCWELTQYYKWNGRKRVWEKDYCTKDAMKRVRELTKLATETATDAEIKANFQHKLCNFKIVAQKYPDTDKGKLVIGACDKLIDYHIEKRIPIIGF